MILKRYQNEMIVLTAFVLMGMSYLYKSSSAGGLDRIKEEVAASTAQLGEIIALKKQWGDADLPKKIEVLKKEIDPKKVKSFDLGSNKLTAVLAGLSDKEMNTIVTRLGNTAVQIIKLNAKKVGESYEMEIQCEW